MGKMMKGNVKIGECWPFFAVSIRRSNHDFVCVVDVMKTSCGGLNKSMLPVHNLGFLLVLDRNAMSISTDARVFVAVCMACAARIWRLSVDHLAVLGNTVAVMVWDVALLLLWLVLGRGPGEIVTTDLDVIVGEFTELVVIHTKEFGLLGCSEVKTRDHVDNVGENGRHDKGVGGAGDDVSNLNVELLVVVVDPAASHTSVDTVESDDVVGSEESVEDESNHTGDTVLSEDIHRIVDADPEFHCFMSVLPLK
jgi:hypothetical protein